MLFMESDIYIQALRRLVERVSGGTKEIAGATGLSAANLEQIVKGVVNPSGRPRGVGPQTRDALSRVYPNWFSTDTNVDKSIDLENNPDYPAIRRVRFKLSAGASGFAIEYQQGSGPPMVFNKSWYAKRNLNPGKLFAVEVSNGSMEAGLHHGDIVVVNTESIIPKDGIVFAANYEGEMVIKRLVRDAGQWWLSSDNADQRRYPRKICDDAVFLIGEIVHKQSERI